VRCFTIGTVLFLSSAACISTPIAPVTPATGAALPRHVRVQFTESGLAVVRDVPLEDYVQAAAISEIAPAAGDFETVERMLEVQTIISRTYAVSHLGRHAREGFDLCSTTHCQLFEPQRLQTSRWAAASSEAIGRTAGLILTFDRQPIQALFHADCGGHTSTPIAVWGGTDRPYLVGRPDDGVASAAHTDWQYEVSVDVLTAALASDARTRVSGALDTIGIVARDSAGRAERIALHGRVRNVGGSSASPVIRGDELRQVLTRAFGPRAIRSTHFDVRRTGSVFTFSGRGYGHGVGLCQAGALARLRAGARPADVVRYYYPGAVLSHDRRPGTGGRRPGSS
jgi:stage II sporulation protein D (peptidoglycan lytic transglycosylase)